jgi:hypothetical protein
MAFGQQSGPPASQKQVAFLKSLLAVAGHDDFRTARHEFGLTQRQAGGKFTVQEASDLIDRLQGIEEPSEPPAVLGRSSEVSERAAARADDLRLTQATVLRGMPADLLATELERRNWVVIPPA